MTLKINGSDGIWGQDPDDGGQPPPPVTSVSGGGLPVAGQSIAGQYVYLEVLPNAGSNQSGLLTSDLLQAGPVTVTYHGTPGQAPTSISFPGLLGTVTIPITASYGEFQDSTAFTFDAGLFGIDPLAVTRYVVSNVPIPNGFLLFDPANPTGNSGYSACYAAGARILTANGEVAVEHLNVGDMVVTASGATRPIKWIGHRRYTLAGLNHPETVTPIRIARGAVSDGVPHRDLLVSPEHAIYLDGALVPARHLVNGTTIAPVMTLTSIAYFHVELDSHDVLVAEGLAAESWLDTGNRAMFANADQTVAQHPAFAARTAESAWASEAFAPLVTSGEALANIRKPLIARAIEAGAMTTDADIHLSIDGHAVAPVSIDGDRYSFTVPSGARAVAIMSRSVVGSDALGNPSEKRRLGVALSGMAISADIGERTIGLADPSLRAGFGVIEGDAVAPFRWTDGYASIPAFLFGGFEDGFNLTLTVAGTVAYPAAALVVEERLALAS